jgi:RimJ/RimL family protein N-acetyltransferase
MPVTATTKDGEPYLLRPEAQGLGLGHMALSRVLLVAREMGYERVWGMIAVHNTAMLGLARRLNFKLSPEADDASLIHAEIDLTTIESAPVAVHNERA